jgi:hypothetical protein
VTGASPPAACLGDARVSTLARRSGETAPQRHFCRGDVADTHAAESPGTRGAAAAERGNPDLTPLRPNADRDQRSAAEDTLTGARRQSPPPRRFVRENPRGPGQRGQSRCLHPPALQTSTTCWRLPCGLWSGETEPTSFCIHLDLFQWLAAFIGVGQLFATSHQTARDVQDLPDGSAGAGERKPRCLQLWIARKGGEQGPGARPSLEVLWWRLAHLPHPLDDADIPAEGRRMMGPRTRTQHSGLSRITFSEPLAPLLHPGFLSVLSCELAPGERLEGVLASSRAASNGHASILLPPWSVPPHDKQPTSCSAPLYLKRRSLLIPEFPVPSPLQKLNRFHEPTPPGVTMTESRTHCASRGECSLFTRLKMRQVYPLR